VEVVVGKGRVMGERSTGTEVEEGQMGKGREDIGDRKPAYI
jgi:hypothetical protein